MKTTNLAILAMYVSLCSACSFHFTGGGENDSTPAPPATVISDYLRETDGSVEPMTQFQAQAYCERHRLRLPTIRELADETKAYGSQVAERSTYANLPVAEQQNYLHVAYIDTFGISHEFYFRNKMYDPALRPVWAWSSSMTAFGQNYLRMSNSGEIGTGQTDPVIGVRCVGAHELTGL